MTDLRAPPSSNPLVTPLLTDLYQLTMAYAYWEAGTIEEPAVFDLFFRKNAFKGEFTIFGGLSEVLSYVQHFKFTKEQVDYLRTVMPKARDGFFDYLTHIDCSKVKISAVREGSVVFPRVPLIVVEGPLGIAQLLETTLLNLVNFASLVATNAARFRLAAGSEKTLLEFGLRRAQGPDGGMSASRYTYMGGFDGTSNVQAGSMFGIPVGGTHAHSFVTTFDAASLDRFSTDLVTIPTADGSSKVNLKEKALVYREKFGYQHTNTGELAAFISYAVAFPDTFLALVDTYETLKSGIPNYLCVANALIDMGYKPKGIRLDSGDLAYLSKKAREMFKQNAAATGREDNANFTIVASNDINENTLYSLRNQGHEIDTFGVGTHLVTCQAQPALGCVYKLVEISGLPRIKLSQEPEKITIPGKKTVYRFFGKKGRPMCDFMTNSDGEVPAKEDKIMCRHPFKGPVRAYIVPSDVKPLLEVWWDGKLVQAIPTLKESKAYCTSQVGALREDHLRALNPTPYKVSLSETLYQFLQELWMKEAPVDVID